MSQDTVTLLVLAKAPHAGRVKTRLCPPATPTQAARVAAAALLDTIEAVRAVPGARPVIAMSGELDGAEGEREISRVLRDVPVMKQRGDGLGERIAAAHEDAAALLPDHAVVQIGMDTPQVDAALLETCRDRLFAAETDAVLGHATDGGWWALGLRDPLSARMMMEVPTSRPDTGANTERALRAGGLRLALLDEMSDVDTMADARSVAATAPGTRFAAAVRELS